MVASALTSPRAPLALGLLLLPLELLSQFRIGTGEAAELYAKHCQICHGRDLQGGLGSNLVDQEWTHAAGDEQIARVIREGLPDLGMQPFADILSEEEIRSLVIYIRELTQIAEKDEIEESLRPQEGVYRTAHHAFRLEEVFSAEGVLWSVAFLPGGDLLLTERGGQLLRVDDSGDAVSIRGIPNVRAQGQGGLLEVALHPDYVDNGWVYLAFSHRLERRGEDMGMTKIVRGRLDGDRWTDEETIFEAPPEAYTGASHHFGTRLVFDDGYLFFTIGDRGRQDQAQDLSRPNGKTHRIHDDGRIPTDNPFVDRADAFASIWTYGNRNQQGLARHPATGALWSTEHGPRGGDEVNLLTPGANYGWPVITYGMNYDGTPITEVTAHPGMEQPVHQWTPSIAVCGIDFYEGDSFPKWRHDLFVTGLASQELRRLALQGGTVVEEEIVLKNEGRVRDVASGPDGLLYVILTDLDRRHSRLCRLVPEE